MKTMQLNSEFFAVMSQVADDEAIMKKIINYAKKLVKKKEDPTEMTKEEFFAKIDKAEKDYREGRCTRLKEGETVTDLLRRNGYDI